MTGYSDSPLGRAMAHGAKRRKARKGALLCDKVLPRRHLQVGSGSFWCPYCERSWDRGGHKEGFVKVAARRHVFGCYEIALFQAGYVRGDYTDDGEIAEPFDPKNEYHARYARMVKNAIRRRTKSPLEEPKA